MFISACITITKSSEVLTRKLLQISENFEKSYHFSRKSFCYVFVCSEPHPAVLRDYLSVFEGSFQPVLRDHSQQGSGDHLMPASELEPLTYKSIFILLLCCLSSFYQQIFRYSQEVCNGYLSKPIYLQCQEGQSFPGF